MQKQNILLADFEQEIQRLTDEITRGKEMPSQEQAGRTELNELLVRLEHELLFVKQEQTILEGLDVEREFVQVELGALVVTDQRIFYISSSVETVEVYGVEIFGISTQAPIYEGMKSKRLGDTFFYGRLSYRILDLY